MRWTQLHARVQGLANKARAGCEPFSSPSWHCNPGLSWLWLRPQGWCSTWPSVGAQRKQFELSWRGLCPSQAPRVSSLLPWAGSGSQEVMFASSSWVLPAACAVLGFSPGYVQPSVHLRRCSFSYIELISFLLLFRLSKQKPQLELAVWVLRTWKTLGT